MNAALDAKRYDGNFVTLAAEEIERHPGFLTQAQCPAI
jgi:hypothetical protein